MLITGLVLVLNLSLITFLTYRNGVGQNLGDIYTWDCGDMEIINMVVHLFLTSIVLALSNFCAQLLAALTRMEVTSAHKNGDWLDVGTPSFRNLFGGRIATKRRLLWVGLALGSAPLHLLSAPSFPFFLNWQQLAKSLPGGTPYSSLLSAWIITS